MKERDYSAGAQCDDCGTPISNRSTWCLRCASGHRNTRPAIEEPGQREAHLALLRELLHHEAELEGREAEAFGDMCARLEREPRRYTGAPRALEPKQRAWAEGVARRLCLSFAPDNSAVPAGAPVETPEVLRHLPKRPPVRRTAV